jgi:hypothetical protein
MVWIRTERFYNLNSAVGRGGVNDIAAKHDLPVAATHSYAARTGDGSDFVLQIAGIHLDLYIDDANQSPHFVENRNIRRSDFLTLEVERAIRHRHRIEDFRRSDHRRGEGALDPKRP